MTWRPCVVVVYPGRDKAAWKASVREPGGRAVGLAHDLVEVELVQFTEADTQAVPLEAELALTSVNVMLRGLRWEAHEGGYRAPAAEWARMPDPEGAA